MDRLILGLQTTAVGMAVVFVALFVLSKLTEALRLLSRSPRPPLRTVQAAAPVPGAAVATAPDEQTELVAAIAGALAAYLDRPVESVRILAVNPAGDGGGSLWKVAGRLKLLEDRLSLYSRRR